MSTPRLLLVDDVESVRTTLKAALEMNGFEEQGLEFLSLS